MISLILPLSFLIIVIAYLVINHLMLYEEDVYTEAVVISMFKGGDILDKTNQLIGNVYNDSVVTIKVKEGTRSRYAKYVNFGRPRKDKKRNRERSRPPLRFLKHIAKKRKKLREIVYHCVRSNTPTSSIKIFSFILSYVWFERHILDIPANRTYFVHDCIHALLVSRITSFNVSSPANTLSSLSPVLIIRRLIVSKQLRIK